MTVAAPAFFNEQHDSAKYSEKPAADPGINFSSDDDYQISRPRHTRRPGREFTLGFTFVTDAQKREVETLYNDARGSSDIITGWEHPIDKVEVLVRFKQGSAPQYQYKGRAGAHYWDITGINLVEV